MDKAREDLRAILDLLAEWRDENGVGYVSVGITPDGSSCAYTFDQSDRDIDLGCIMYSDHKNETPAAGTARESK